MSVKRKETRGRGLVSTRNSLEGADRLNMGALVSGKAGVQCRAAKRSVGTKCVGRSINPHVPSQPWQPDSHPPCPA